MKLDGISRFLIPGYISGKLAYGASLVAMAVIFAAGISADFSIRLFVLYVLPLVLISLHCGRYVAYVAAVGIVLGLEAFTLARFNFNFATIVTNLLFEGLVAGMIVLVTSTARTNYLKVAQQATTDELTNLANRRAFERVADHEIARQKRYGGVFSLAMLDLDGFKELNDSRGHRSGDEALKLFAEVIRSKTRESDTVARYGGDEFIVLMPNTSEVESLALCQQLRTVVAARMTEASFYVTVSIGCATFTEPPNSVESAIAQADTAMYQAKKSGKNCVICC